MLLAPARYSMPPQIPSELVEHIMDTLSSDRRALGICGLVCSEWLPRSRHLLFSSSIVPSFGEKSTLFIELLQSPLCKFASYVCDLCIDGDQKTTSAAASEKEFYILVTNPAFGRLACADSLRLSNIDWTTFSVGEQLAIESGLSRFHGLKKLELLSVSFHDFTGVLRLASSFPLLHHIRLLHLHFSKYLEHNITSAKTHRIPPTLETIEIDSGDTVLVFLHCICANLSVAPLGIHLLKLLHIEQGHRQSVQEAIRSIASQTEKQPTHRDQTTGNCP
ncbi:hypothetical protein DFH09DRAFT_658507 [Mycena vulgaris]|nr:hypothetical protein DFH09DRAFT_658507 [Mycena vulgaris]